MAGPALEPGDKTIMKHGLSPHAAQNLAGKTLNK